jgi:hypothetical protein
MTEPTPVVEVLEAYSWIRTTLRAHTEVIAISGLADRIWIGVAPPDSTYPFITMNVLAATDRMGAARPRSIWADCLVLVRGTLNGPNPAALRPVALAIHKALHGKRGTTSVARIVASVRERPHSPPPETENNQWYVHLGGEYRIKVRPL